MRAALAAALAAAVSASPAVAAPGRISVGLSPGVAPAEAAAAVEASTGGAVVGDLGPLRALVVDVPDVDSALVDARAAVGVDFAEPVAVERTLAFVPNDPLADSQWYLSAIRAFDHWAQKPPLAPVRVAVIDSGVDAGHPEFAGRIVAARTFVSSPANVDAVGHGTVVAGEIAAALDNSLGIAGVGFPVELVIAKVVSPRGTISLEAEARAIRWAVAEHADVINLSLGGPRDPRNPRRDTYSQLEHSAIDFATRHGVVVVAAAGNCFDICPDPYANYPAALPHVIGVSAVARNGSTPLFSNRDAVHNDLAAPGVSIVSTFPRALSREGCAPAGYTVCSRPASYREPGGTSFSAPLVSAAAALLIGQGAALGLVPVESSQVTAALERTARDLDRPGRDRRSGNGLLDVSAGLDSLTGPLPAPDRYEANDDAGARAFALWGQSRVVDATLDRYEDPRDVYRVMLRAGQSVVFRLTSSGGANVDLALWRPETRRVAAPSLKNRVAVARRRGAWERLSYRAARGGWYFLETRLTGGRGSSYRLSVEKRFVRAP